MNGTPRGDEGMTLVETLVAVSIVGLSFSALVGGMYTTVQASDINRKQAAAATALATYAEAVKADPYIACATSYTGTTFTAPAGFTKAPVVVSYWKPASTPPTFATPCGTDSGLQRVTLALRSTDGRVVLDVELAKRRT